MWTVNRSAPHMTVWQLPAHASARPVTVRDLPPGQVVALRVARDGDVADGVPASDCALGYAKHLLTGGLAGSIVGYDYLIRARIEVLVLASVFVVLLLLLRRFVVSLYLLLSVLFSYYVTLGAAMLLFWALDPAGFNGVDWKVAIFLFTILIAVGEDYNIFLMTRVDEEEKRFGPVRGVTQALERTGPIISSCGIIMAGTFASLLAGKLDEMTQLGFALTFGVLLDTFVVRPILAPAFLILLGSGRLSFFGRPAPPPEPPPDALAQLRDTRPRSEQRSETGS